LKEIFHDFYGIEFLFRDRSEPLHQAERGPLSVFRSGKDTATARHGSAAFMDVAVFYRNGAVSC
jgi:hypothetical protein